MVTFVDREFLRAELLNLRDQSGRGIQDVRRSALIRRCRAVVSEIKHSNEGDGIRKLADVLELMFDELLP